MTLKMKSDRMKSTLMSYEAVMTKIFGVPNTWNSCSYVILQKGYRVGIIHESHNNGIKTTCVATKKNRHFVADNFLSLLGIISLHENLGYSLHELRQESHELSLKIPEIYRELVFDDDDD